MSKLIEKLEALKTSDEKFMVTDDTGKVCS
jgi:hypothetical protein